MWLIAGMVIFLFIIAGVLLALDSGLFDDF